jgi:hypothetical protein
MKVRVDNRCLIFWCPGCKCAHRVPVNGRQLQSGYTWAWNGSETSPTLLPAMNYNMTDPAAHCHLFVTDGALQFMPDCWHELAGKTVVMPEWAVWNPS